MGLLDNVIILLLIISAFLSGKLISDRYNEEIKSEMEYLIRLNAAQNGTGYVQPPKKYAPIGQPFMDKLKETGKAVQKINRS